MTWWGRLCLALALFISHPVAAQSNAEFEQRATELVQILSAKSDDLDFFAPSFTAQVPPGQISALAARLIAQHGAVIGIGSISQRSSNEASVTIRYARADVRFNVVVDPLAPHRVIGLWLISATRIGDSVEMLRTDFATLPGKSAILITSLSESATKPLLAYRADQVMAVGSSFKLWLLAEAVRQVKAGERRWSDVIPLGAPSLPSGITQDWPKGTATTFQTLATLAISISDNTASDTLLDALGRRNVETMVRQIGPQSSRPLLSTIEAFALKMRANDDLRIAFETRDAPAARTILEANRARLSLSAIDRTQLAGTPNHIDSVEWFASPRDMAKTLNWLRTQADSEARAVLSITKGLPIGEAERFSYVGYKGGSEIGVIAMNYLVQSKSGQYYAVTGSWNDSKAAVDQAKFEALMSRAVALVAKQ